MGQKVHEEGCELDLAPVGRNQPSASRCFRLPARRSTSHAGRRPLSGLGTRKAEVLDGPQEWRHLLVPDAPSASGPPTRTCARLAGSVMAADIAESRADATARGIGRLHRQSRSARAGPRVSSSAEDRDPRRSRCRRTGRDLCASDSAQAMAQLVQLKARTRERPMGGSARLPCCRTDGHEPPTPAWLIPGDRCLQAEGEVLALRDLLLQTRITGGLEIRPAGSGRPRVAPPSHAVVSTDLVEELASLCPAAQQLFRHAKGRIGRMLARPTQQDVVDAALDLSIRSLRVCEDMSAPTHLSSFHLGSSAEVRWLCHVRDLRQARRARRRAKRIASVRSILSAGDHLRSAQQHLVKRFIVISVVLSVALR